MLVIGCALVIGCGENVKSGIDRGSRLIIAVLQPENRSGQADMTAEIAELDARIIAELTNTDCYRIIERERLSQTLKEHGLSIIGIVDPERAVILGKLLGIDAILYTSVSKLKINERQQILGTVEQMVQDSDALIEGRIIDVSTGEILVTGAGQGIAGEEPAATALIQTKALQDRKSLLRTSLGNALKDYCMNLGRRAVPRKKQ
jgi:curli biogenesis system outer membrane secretion channel CsgG